jgi:hypothetical protein
MATRLEFDPISEVRPAGKPDRAALARLAAARDYGKRVVEAEAAVDSDSAERAVRLNRNQQPGHRP